jgi:GT2 family glycosyltransferase
MAVAVRVFEWVLFSLVGWTFAVAMAGFLPRRAPPRAAPRLRFLVLVPARDEAPVIADVVRALLAQDYPRRLFRIAVVADGCRDDTAARARAAGADVVLERHDPARRGKGQALAWALERAGRGFAPDAVAVFDADNVMAPGFLAAMNARLLAGAAIVQGRLETKNPDDSWITQASALGQVVAARLFQRSRARLGFSAALAGTGFAIRRETLRAHPPDPRCLVDDLELQLRLLRAGVRVAWAPEAVSWDEKPITMRASLDQRVRWARGHLDVLRRHTGPLLVRAARRADLAALDGALGCLQPSRSVNAVLAATLVTARLAAPAAGVDLAGIFTIPLPAWLALLACHAIFPGAALLAERVPPRVALRYAWTAVFQATWLPVFVAGLVRRGRGWKPTRHVRSVPVDRLASRRAASPTRESVA